MKITVKVLKGDECELEVIINTIHCFCDITRVFTFFKVSEATTVLELKEKVEQALHIPVAYQKLLCIGRTLVDDKTLGTYSPAIKPGCKLTLVVKEPETLREVLQKLFKRFYAEDQSEELTKALMMELEKRVGQLSLDDMERLATHYLELRERSFGQTTHAQATVAP